MNTSPLQNPPGGAPVPVQALVGPARLRRLHGPDQPHGALQRRNQLHGLGLSTRTKIAVAAPTLLLMALFYANSSDSILGAPKLTMIMYAGTLLTALTVWVLMRAARLMGVVLRA